MAFCEPVQIATAVSTTVYAQRQFLVLVGERDARELADAHQGDSYRINHERNVRRYGLPAGSPSGMCSRFCGGRQ